MNYETLGLLAVLALVYSATSGWFEHKSVNGALVYMTFGMLFGSVGLGWLDLDIGNEGLRLIAETTLGVGAARECFFVGWFGLRGLASIVFSVIVLQAHLPGVETMVMTVILTVLLSVMAHGVSANPLVSCCSLIAPIKDGGINASRYNRQR